VSLADERDLVYRAQHNDKEAFAEIYEGYFDRIYRYVVLKIGNRSEAEDITQAVFIKALENIGRFKWKGAPFASWLFRIAHNQIIDYVRKMKKRSAGELPEQIPSQDDGPAAITEKNSEIERMMTATKNLTDLQRDIINLRFAAGLSIAEAAGIMNKNENAIKALQHSAVRALRRELAVEI
jgi:RNA polymerase sigma-70 factor, ECF subfamily